MLTPYLITMWGTLARMFNPESAPPSTPALTFELAVSMWGLGRRAAGYNSYWGKE